MKALLLQAIALAAIANGAVLDSLQQMRARDPQRRTTIRPTITFFPGPGSPSDVEACGLDAFVGHEDEALLFCSSLLRSGTATKTSTYTTRSTTTVRTTVVTTLFPSSTPKPSSTTARPPSSTARPSSTAPVTTPSPSPSAGCGIVGYTGSTAAYFFDSSGTKNTWATCSAACKADSKCKSFGYGEANCMLFDVAATGNTNYNPMSPYTFYDVSCPEELPVLKRQINISLGLGGPGPISSACSCLITSGPAGVTRTTTVTVTSVRVTRTETTTLTVSVLG